jgi:hypothetical protein
MKIAYVLSGQPRNFIKGNETILKFLNKQNKVEVDFFFHCWSLNEGQIYKTSPWRNICKEETSYKKNTEDELLKLYNPKAYKFEKQREHFNEIEYLNTLAYNNTPESNKKNIYNTLSNFYSKSKARDLFLEYVTKNNAKYDCIIYSRFDLYNEINLLLEKIDLTYVHISDLFKDVALPDWHIICPQHIFLEWFNFYDFNIKNILNSAEINNLMKIKKTDIRINPEQLLTASYLFYNKNFDNICYHKELPNFI